MSVRLDEARIRLLNINGGILPTVNNTYNLGTSSLKWANIYATTFHGALDGNATKATQDADGNTISSTYLKCSGGTMTGSIYYGNSGLYYTSAKYGYQQIKALYLTIDKNNLSSSSIYSYVPTQITTDFGSNNYIDIIPTGFHTYLYLGKTFTRLTYETAGDTSSNYTSLTYVTNTCIALRGMDSTTKELSPYYNIYSFPPNFGDDTSTKLYYILTSRNIKISSTNKLLYTSGTSYGGSLSTSNHYASSTKIAINSPSDPSYNLYVNGSTGHNGSITVTSNHITVDNGDIYINKNYYPSFYLTATNKNSASTYSRAAFECNYSDSVAMWINSDSTTTSKSRRGLVLYGYALKSDAALALALRLCDTSGSWLSDLYLLHTGNYTNYTVTKTGSGASGNNWAIGITGNAATASKLATARTISLTGSVTGSGTFDGSGNLSIATTTNHTHSYLPLSGGTMNDLAWIAWPDTGNWSNSNAGVTFPVRHGGLQWSGLSDWIKIFSEESASDMLDMIMLFGDDGSSALKIRHSNGTDYVKISAAGRIDASTVYGAVWNDYAEFRESNEQILPGRVVIENGDDTLSLSNERLQPGANIVSDTYGFAIGETSRAKTPIAVSGRVLAYPYEPRDTFSAGDAVCSGPNGTVSKMTREEIVMYPERIIGTVSAIPDYEIWGTGNVPVNGRIWIKVV